MSFFQTISFPKMDLRLIYKSFGEVFWLSLIAFFPVVLSILIQAAKLNSLGSSISFIHPGEILAFCLSFLAPSIFFLKKTHGSEYKLPFLDLYFFSTLGMYIIALFFTVMIKLNIDQEITNNLNNRVTYLTTSFVFLFLTIIFRIYSVYHTSKSSDFLKNKGLEQNKFNEDFKNLINGN